MDLRQFELRELKELMNELKEQEYRAVQIFEFIHRSNKNTLPVIIGKSLIEKLKGFKISSLKIERKMYSKNCGTIKYLFKTEDSEFIETVIMSYKHGYSICLSTQIGCNMKCKFCASTLNGFKRNLSAGEIEAQILAAEEDLNIKISNIVLMGIGEPLANFDNVIKFLRNVNNKHGLNIGYRHISLSTCGLVPKMYKLNEESLPITLSVSLHAANDKKRSEIMPINQVYPIKQLILACKSFKRRISFEYALINNFNDTIKDADELSRLIKGMNAHVNLIPVNTVKETNFKRSKNVNTFKERLEKNNIKTTIRRELGKDIDAACGQLRNKHEAED